MTKYFLLTKMKYSEYDFPLHMMMSEAFSIYFLLKVKNGLVNL